jgi:hypothetical protein
MIYKFTLGQPKNEHGTHTLVNLTFNLQKTEETAFKTCTVSVLGFNTQNMRKPAELLCLSNCVYNFTGFSPPTVLRLSRKELIPKFLA